MSKIVCGESTTTEMISAINSNTTKPSAAGHLMSKMANNGRRTSVLVIGDQTSVNIDDWPYLLAEWYAGMFPKIDIRYTVWDTATSKYEDLVIVSEGTDSYQSSLTIYNASVDDIGSSYFLGEHKEEAIRKAFDTDLIIINQGHQNRKTYASGGVIGLVVPHTMEVALTVCELYPDAGLIIHNQNPMQDSVLSRGSYLASIESAALMGADLADSYSEFMSRDKDISLYEDNERPSPAGSQLMLKAVTDLHSSTTPKVPAFSITDGGLNLLTNGTFSDYTGDAPVGWTRHNGTCEKNLTIHESVTHSWSVSPVASETALTNGHPTYLSQSLSAAQIAKYAGKWLTLAVRVYVPSEGTTTTAGRIGLIGTFEQYHVTPPSLEGRNGFKWLMMSYKLRSTGETYVGVQLYSDTDGGGGSAYFDRAILVPGRIPKDVY